jgi:hypothetical protein
MKLNESVKLETQNREERGIMFVRMSTDASTIAEAVNIHEIDALPVDRTCFETKPSTIEKENGLEI